jgi:transposase
MLEAGSLERMGEMANGRGRYPAEVRERAVRMVFEHQGEYATQWSAIVSIAEKFGTSA